MLNFLYKDYYKIKDIPDDTKQIRLIDHIDGFNKYYKNDLLEILNLRDTSEKIEVHYHAYLPDVVKSNYPNLDIKFDIQRQEELNFSKAQVAINLKPHVEDETDSGNDNVIKFSPNLH